MYSARFLRTEEVANGTRYVVRFSNGTKTIEEWCIPQNEAGFKIWVKSRLEALNATITLGSQLVPNAPINPEEPETPEPVLTPEEIERNIWLNKYSQWVRIKTTIIDTGILPITNPRLKTLLDELKSNLKPEYIDYI